MKLHYLNCGTMFPKLAKWFIPQLRWVPAICILVEKADSFLLIDTGYGTLDMADTSRLGPANKVINARPNMEETAIYQLKKMGIDPERVENIICTHLDADHAGGLSDFPWANVHVMRKEYLAVVEPKNPAEKRRYRRCQMEHGPRWVLHEESEISEQKWFGLECIRNIDGLPPEIVLIPLYGHTRGHCAVAIDTGEGWVLYCGDTYYVSHELSGRAPIGVTLFEMAAHTYYPMAKASLKKLKTALAVAKQQVTPVAPHDPAAFRRLFGTPE